MPLHPRLGCFVYNDSTFWSMFAHGVATRAAEYGATVEVLSARDADGRDRILAQMIARRVDALVLGVIDPERGARSAAPLPMRTSRSSRWWPICPAR